MRVTAIKPETDEIGPTDLSTALEKRPSGQDDAGWRLDPRDAARLRDRSHRTGRETLVHWAKSGDLALRRQATWGMSVGMARVCAPREPEAQMTDTHTARDLFARHHAAFDAGEATGMLGCVSGDIERRVNEGGIRRGPARLSELCARMGVSHAEAQRGIEILSGENGSRAADKPTMHGTSPVTDAGLPAAAGQTCVPPAVAFFEAAGEKFTRTTTLFNLADVVAKVLA